MLEKGYAQYNSSNNTLEVVRSGEQGTRIIHCSNLNPAAVQVFGVEVVGDETHVYVGGHTNRRPSHIRVYSMKSLNGGSMRTL